MSEYCGQISAATLDDLVAKEVLRALEPAALELSLRAIENVEQERKRLHDQWRQTLERAGQEVARAERQYHAVEPENRLVARTLEARWEDALEEATPGGGGISSIPGETPGLDRRCGSGANQVAFRERRHALACGRDVGGGSEADHSLRRRASDPGVR